MLNDDFSFDTQKLLAAVTPNTKMIIICSPNNPTGIAYPTEQIIEVVKNFKGLVVVDEAYNDFSDVESCINYLKDFDNLVVIQTFSKAWGLASLRAGVGYMSKELAAMINKVKLPYNMDGFTQKSLVEKLQDVDGFKNTVKLLVSERDRFMANVATLPYIEKVFRSDANFFMIRTAKHKELQQFMVNNGVILRSRHGMPMCDNCIRITVGTPEQNDLAFRLMQKFGK